MNTQHHETDSTQGLWRTRGYPTWFTADTATAVGVALRTLAITLLGYHISGSTVTAGWIGSASMVAQQVCSVFCARPPNKTAKEKAAEYVKNYPADEAGIRENNFLKTR